MKVYIVLRDNYVYKITKSRKKAEVYKRKASRDRALAGSMDDRVYIVESRFDG